MYNAHFYVLTMQSFWLNSLVGLLYGKYCVNFLLPEPPVGRFAVRRKSVFAETYNPEDDEDDGPKLVFPKTDEQRSALTEAVKNILLFRALDKEQMQDVLDAMFEKKVSAGDYIIKQGDDGDNFYVIQE